MLRRDVVAVQEHSRINKRLKCGTHLTASKAYVVVLEVFVIDAAYVCLHMTSLRLHAHHAAAEKFLII